MSTPSSRTGSARTPDIKKPAKKRRPARARPRIPRPRLPLPERLEALSADIDRVRTREEARLLRIARKAGYFRHRQSTARIKALFQNVDTDARKSQLARLEDSMKRTRKQISEQARRDDARRKILLGAFLIAQFNHKPALRAELLPELITFLEQHPDPKVVAANKTLLAEFTC